VSHPSRCWYHHQKSPAGMTKNRANSQATFPSIAGFCTALYSSFQSALRRVCFPFERESWITKCFSTKTQALTMRDKLLSWHAFDSTDYGYPDAISTAVVLPLTVSSGWSVGLSSPVGQPGPNLTFAPSYVLGGPLNFCQDWASHSAPHKSQALAIVTLYYR